MFLVELVMQGVRGFRELARLRFQSGFNLVAAGNEAGKTAAVDSMQRLLFPVDEPSRIAPLISRFAPDASRGALVVYSDDGGYYRLIQDFSKRAVNLSKYNPATKEFSLMYKTWESAVPFMTGLTAGIAEEEYARIFIIRRDQRAVSSASTIAPVAAPPVRNQPAAKSGKTAASEARLAELRETLRKAEEAADAEYRLQSGKLRLDELQKKLESLDEIDNKYAEMEARLEELKGCADLPPNLAELIDAHVEQQSKKMADSDDLQEQLAALKAQLDSMPEANLFSDKLFIGGVVVAGVSLIAALAVLPSYPRLDYLFPLGILAAAILIVSAWYRGTRGSAQRKVVQKEIGALEADLVALEKNFEQGGASIMACMKSTGSKTTEELKEKVDNYRHFLSLREEIAEQQQRIYGGVTHKALLEDYQNQQLEVIELDKAARAVAHNAVDTYSLRQDIDRIVSELPGGGPSSAPSWDVGAPELCDFGAPDLGGVAPGTGFLEELGIASRIGAIEMETLIPAVEAAAQRNLTAVTAGKYVRIEIAGDAGPQVHGKDNTAVQVADLSPSTQELISFCIRTGIVEALVGKRRLPLLLDDPLAGFDPMRQKAACQVLRSLGARTQVVLFTSNPELKIPGDVYAELK